MFIGGLPPQLTKTQLKEALTEFMPFSIQMKKRPGKTTNRGYAFLIMSDLNKATQLSKATLTIQGRIIQAQFSLKSESANMQQAGRIYLKNLPISVSDDAILNVLKKYVDCRSAYAIRDSSGTSKGFGYVELSNQEDEEKLLKLGSISFCPGQAPSLIEPYLKQNKKKRLIQNEAKDFELNENRRASEAEVLHVQDSQLSSGGLGISVNSQYPKLALASDDCQQNYYYHGFAKKKVSLIVTSERLDNSAENIYNYRSKSSLNIRRTFAERPSSSAGLPLSTGKVIGSRSHQIANLRFNVRVGLLDETVQNKDANPGQLQVGNFKKISK